MSATPSKESGISRPHAMDLIDRNKAIARAIHLLIELPVFAEVWDTAVVELEKIEGRGFVAHVRKYSRAVPVFQDSLGDASSFLKQNQLLTEIEYATVASVDG